MYSHHHVLEAGEDKDEYGEVQGHNFTGVFPSAGPQPQSHTDEEVAAYTPKKTGTPAFICLCDRHALGVGDETCRGVDIGVVTFEISM